jgi:hypothetical protein
MQLNIPPGLRRAATQHATGSAWHDMSLVRWNGERMQPIGGWASLPGLTLTDAPRALLSWRQNSGQIWVAAASLGQIVTWDTVLYDITPSDFVPGSFADLMDGFGMGDFGVDLYGTPRDIGATSPTPLGPPSDQVSLDTWGEELIVVGSADGRILLWSPTIPSTPLTVIPPADPSATEAPDIVHIVPQCWAAFVTDERFIVALGADGDPRRVSWSDQERPGAWTPDITNLCGSLQLKSTGRALTARKVPQGYLIFCTDDVHLMAWAGPPYAYGAARVGSACGPVGSMAVASILGHTVWMGRQSFWQWYGVPVPLACPFQGFVFDNLSVTNSQRAFACANGVNPEIWFFYPDGNNVDPNRYVVWNFMTNQWFAGSLARTGGCEPASYGLPLMGDASGAVYAHETGFLADGADRGADVFAETGDIMLDQGDRAMLIRAIVPDLENQVQTQFRLSGSWEPEDELEDYGAFPYTRTDGLIDALVEARAIRLRIEGVPQANTSLVASWTLGRIALDAVPGAAR